MESEKAAEQDKKSAPESTGDRRAGSVGERPELAGSRDSGDRSGKKKTHSVADEIAGITERTIRV